MVELSEAERDAIAAQFWDGTLIGGREGQWSDMTQAEQLACIADWRAKHPATPAPDPLFTPEQSARIASVISGALPKLMKRYITEEAMNEHLASAEAALNERLLAIESKFALALSDTLGAIEGAVVGKKAPDGSGDALAGQCAQLRRDLEDVKSGLLTSHTRQLTRHSEHLATLQAKVTKLSRGD